mmetsp:Transcript_16148/g.24691  ORF Transcript_16148/g.24691 Transcript_16148/m.24691 type:complete len:453 (-) Transcript_16148:22-1380(-)
MAISSSFYNEHCSLLPYLLLWFLFSTTLSMTNRYAFGILRFPLLLFATSVHFFAQYLFSLFYTRCFHQDKIELYRNMSWRTYLEIALPVGISSALDVGLSNLGMSLVPISVYTIVKSATPLFVLIMSFSMGLAKPSVRLCLVMLLITAGEVLTVKKHEELISVGSNTTVGNATDADFETTTSTFFNDTINFNLTVKEDDTMEENPLACEYHSPDTVETEMVKGIIMLLLSCFFSAVRWTMLQLKITSLPEPLRSPIATIRIISPSMFLSLLPVALGLEYEGFAVLHTCSKEALAIGFSNGLLAIPLMLAEYTLLIKSSAIVLMIGGVCKEILTILLGVILFHEVVTGRAWIGFVVVTMGAILYKIDKIKSKERQYQSVVEDDESMIVNGSNGGEENEIEMGVTKPYTDEVTHDKVHVVEHFSIDDDDEEEDVIDDPDKEEPSKVLVSNGEIS